MDKTNIEDKQVAQITVRSLARNLELVTTKCLKRVLDICRFTVESFNRLINTIPAFLKLLGGSPAAVGEASFGSTIPV
jgi:hypothetical protein